MSTIIPMSTGSFSTPTIFKISGPLGHIWKFDLEQRKNHDFGVKWNFSKTRIKQVMLKFLATTEKIRKQYQKNRTTIAGK